MPITLGQASGFRQRAKFAGSLLVEKVNVSSYCMLGLKKGASCQAVGLFLGQGQEKQKH